MKLPFVKTDIQVRFSDLDILGHVSNSVYAQYFDMGRIDWYNIIAEKENPERSVVVSIKMDIFDEIKLKDIVHIETWCSEIGNKSFTLTQNIYCNRICVTRASVVSVCVDRDTRQSIPLPGHWETSELVGAI
jgi:acyl-CoA thioester hydrolase